jgi:hypothetical protein
MPTIISLDRGELQTVINVTLDTIPALLLGLVLGELRPLQGARLFIQRPNTCMLVAKALPRTLVHLWS